MPASHLDAAARAALGRELHRRAAELRGEIAQALRQPEDAGTAHLVNHLNAVDDAALADLESALDIAALQRDLGELQAVEAALGRLDEAAFGVCADCDADIPLARLRAQPAATRCLDCQAAWERSRGATGAPSL